MQPPYETGLLDVKNELLRSTTLPSALLETTQLSLVAFSRSLYPFIHLA